MKTGCFFTILILFSGQADAAPRFSALFAENAVIQRGKSTAISGFDAAPESSLSVRFGDIKAEAVVQAEGHWKATFSDLKATSEERTLELIENGKVVATVNGVVVGDVWLAAGQSNMQMQVRSMVKGMPSAKSWVESGSLPRVRFRRINDEVMFSRIEEPPDLNDPNPWVKMSPESVVNFSALAAVYAREIAQKVGIPVGIIDVSWGGKPIESFIAREAFATPLLQKIKDLADAEDLEALKTWHGGLIIRNPEGYPGSIFNARIAPITKYKLSGFIWYQAESNAGRGEDPREYREKMEALASGWRNRWNDESLPLYFVQLPSFPPATGWIRAREEQRLALAIPRSAMAVTIDIRGEGIHPPDKIEVGKRLAKCALKNTYGKSDVVASGPVYESHKIEGSRVTVHFSEITGGLFAGNRPLFSNVVEDGNLKWFEVAGADGEWHAADAKILGKTVVVECDEEPNPEAVRYACHTNPQGGNLYNRAGLPASPFCSDLEMLGWEDQPAIEQ